MTFVITGASDGIGAAAARQAAALGHNVVVIGRNPQKTQAVAESIGARHHTVDFTSLASTAELAERLLSDLDHVDVLANNAGGMTPSRRVTEDGFEQTFQMNHLAPFLLTQRLLPVLLHSRARVVFTSSFAARQGTIHTDDLQLERDWGQYTAYAQTKLAQALTAAELQRRYGDQGLIATSFHPGVIGSNFGHDGPSWMSWAFRSGLARRILPSVDTGARRLLWLATASPEAGWQPGGYHTANRPFRLDPRKASREVGEWLWDESLRLLAPWLAQRT